MSSSPIVSASFLHNKRRQKSRLTKMTSAARPLAIGSAHARLPGIHHSAALRLAHSKAPSGVAAGLYEPERAVPGAWYREPGVLRVYCFDKMRVLQQACHGGTTIVSETDRALITMPPLD